MRRTARTVFLALVCVSIGFGSTDDEIFKEIARKLRSVPEMADVYNVGPAVPKVHKSGRAVVAENICPSTQQWANLSRALTADGSEVTVIQGMFGWAYQWFYTVQCSPHAENRTCRWIDEKQAPRTACKTMYNLVPAIVRIDFLDEASVAQSTYDWRMIRVPGQCGCYRLRSAASSQPPTPYGTKLSALN